MSKFSSFAEYPPRSLAGAEAALLTAWASLERFHDDLVLVGGLAVRYLTKQGAGLLPGPVTMDVDLGVTLAAEAGGQYGSMADDLTGQGFKRDEKGRYVRQFETGQSGPLRCAAFALDGQPGFDDHQMRERQIVEQLVTIGRALAGEG